MASQQLYMFPEQKIDELETDIHNLRRALFARINEVEKDMKAVSATCDGNTIDFVEIRRLLEEAREKML